MAKTIWLRDWTEDEGTPLARRGLIIERNGSFCAYVGVPSNNPLAGRVYDDMPLECHGGLTFGSEGGDGGWPKGWYWYGWDYMHSGDRTTFWKKGHQWTVEEVEDEARQVMDQLRDLLAEAMVD